MKKLLILALIAFSTFNAFSQNLQKGNLVGLHTVTVKLNAKTTMDQLVDFMSTKWTAAESKFYSCDVKLLKYVRGVAVGTDKLTFLIIYKDAASRNKFYNPDGTTNEGGKAAEAKMKSITDEFNKLASIVKNEYTDWEVK